MRTDKEREKEREQPEKEKKIEDSQRERKRLRTVIERTVRDCNWSGIENNSLRFTIMV